MIKIYAFFEEFEEFEGKEPGAGPFNLDSRAGRAAIIKRFPGLQHYRQFLRAPEQLAGWPVAPYLGSAELWLDDDGDPAPILSCLDTASTTLAELFSHDPVLLIQSQEHTYDGITELFWPDHATALASMASEQMTVDQPNDAQNFVAGESLVLVMEQETP